MSVLISKKMVLLCAVMSILSADHYRVLIDNSGSMKKNDPKKQVLKAVEMLFLLLDEKSTLEISTFDSKVNSLIKKGLDHHQLKTVWEQAISGVNFSGLRTNIPKALESSLHDWTAEGKKHLILLTDGLVDVSPDSQKNAQERKRLIAEVLPKLQKNEIAVHSVSLGHGTDEELLKIVSHATLGTWKKVSADFELYDFFISFMSDRSYLQTIPKSKQHTIKVDRSLDDLIIIFKTHQPALLTSPSGVIHNLKELPYIQCGPYLVGKIQQPEPGIWRFDYNSSQEMKFFSLSDLQLELATTKSHLLTDDSLELQAKIIYPNQVPTDFVFADLTLKLEHVSPEDYQVIRHYENPFCHTIIVAKLPEKTQSLTVNAEHPLFSRAKKLEISIHESPITWQEVYLDKKNHIKVQLDKTFWSFNDRLKVSLEDLDRQQTDCSRLHDDFICDMGDNPEQIMYRIYAQGTDLLLHPREYTTPFFTETYIKIEEKQQPIPDIKIDIPLQTAEHEPQKTSSDDSLQQKTSSDDSPQQPPQPPQDVIKPEVPPVDNSNSLAPEVKPSQPVSDFKQKAGFFLGLQLLLVGVGFLLWRLVFKKMDLNKDDLAKNLME